MARLLILGLILAGITYGPAAFQQALAVKNLLYSFRRVRNFDIAGGMLDFDVEVAFTNPAAQPLKIDSLFSVLTFNGEKMAESLIVNPIIIEAQRSTDVIIPIRDINLLQTGLNVFTVLSGQIGAKVDLRGAASVNGVPIPFEIQNLQARFV